MSGSPCVLVVEDDDSVRDLLQTLLTEDGFTVLPASSGEHALGAISAAQVDVVLLDLGLPGLNGEEFVQAWRDLVPAASLVPIVVVSGAERGPQLARAMGATAYFGKPYSFDAVIAEVRGLTSSAGPAPSPA